MRTALRGLFVLAFVLGTTSLPLTAAHASGPSTLARSAGATGLPTVLTFQAADGTENVVNMTQITRLLLISDNSGEGITPPSPLSLCVPTGTSAVACVITPLDSLVVNLGDLDDTANVASADLLNLFPIPAAINGGPGDDNLRGGDGVDTITGGPGNDTMRGGLGNDSFVADPGAVSDGDDFIDGQGGTDLANYSARTGSLFITADDVNDDGLVGEKDNVKSSIENINGGSGADTLVGNASVNLINGNGDVDTIKGGDGNDTLNGNAGADQIDTDGAGLLDSGDDTINGGDGNDTLGNAANGAGVDTIHGDGDDDTIFGGLANDSLFGDAGNDTIHGNDGDDTIKGGIGNDFVFGGNGNDTIDGEDGFDSLNGDAGNDTINGGNDGDIIRGGTGDDTLHGNAGNDLIYGDDGTDFCEGDTGVDEEQQSTCESSN